MQSVNKEISESVSQSNFWQELKKPIIALAPMEDVTDTVFRELVMGISEPEMLNVVFAEFTSTDGMAHETGWLHVIHRLHVADSERELLNAHGTKIVAQIWGSDPEKFYTAAKLINNEFEFDGIDINMGCPVKKIVKQASCSELIKYPELAKEIIEAAKEGSKIPVSVKTRTGISQHDTENWIGHLLSVEPAAITLHARTQKMMSEKPAEWSEISKAVKLRNESGKNIPILGNGDLFSMAMALSKIEEYGIDGVMIGRGIFEDPWFFNSTKILPTPRERLELLRTHANRFVERWGKRKNFAILRRFFKIYTREFYGAGEIRAKMMETKNIEEVERLLSESQYFRE